MAKKKEPRLLPEILKNIQKQDWSGTGPPRPEREPTFRETQKWAGVPERYIRIHKMDPPQGGWPNFSQTMENICIRGGTGSGKSTMAAELVGRFCQATATDPKRVEWISCKLFIDRVKSTAAPAATENTWQILNHLRNKKLIVLDDFGIGRNHEWDRGIMQSLVWQCWDHCIPLIITTKKTLQEFDSEDDAGASRLASMREILMGDIDHRNQGASDAKKA